MTYGDISTIQLRPDEKFALDSSEFQRRAEPNFAWKSAVSSTMVLPGLRAGWSMSTIFVDAQDNPLIADLGNDFHLSLNNNPTFGNDGLAPYMETDGATEYAYYVDHPSFDIQADVAGEPWIASADRGITLGGWFYFNTATVATGKGLIGKWNSTGNQKSYLLYHRASDDTIIMAVSDDGAVSIMSAASIVPDVDTWYCIFGRYDRTSLDVETFINGTWYTNAGAGLGAIHSGTATFEVHSYEAGLASTLWDGRSSLLSLCQRSVTNSILNQFYHQTRAMFGV